MRFATHLILFACLAALSAAPLGAQAPPDTLDGARFFPLAVGNEWHYSERVYNGLGGIEEEWTEAWKIVDSVRIALPDSSAEHLYYELQACNDRAEAGQPVCDLWPLLLRYDAAVGAVLDLDDTFTEHLWYDLPCPLGNGPYGEETPLPGDGACFPEEAIYVEADAAVQIGSDLLTGMTSRTYITLASSSTVVEGIGLVQVGVGDPSLEIVSELRFARIGDQEYGEPGFAFPNSSAPSPVARVFTASVGPNPTRGPVRATVAGAVPGPLRVDAFDLLGRRVAGETKVTNGSDTVLIDLRGAAPGLYLVRITSPDRVVTRRVTVAR